MGITHPKCSGPLSRRSFLNLGMLGLSGLGLSDFLRLRAEGKTTSAPDTAVILVWLPGGMSHIDTYDMKPDAPVEYRGEFRPARTVVPGLDVCDLLPRHAKVAKQFSIALRFLWLHSTRRRNQANADGGLPRPEGEGANSILSSAPLCRSA